VPNLPARELDQQQRYLEDHGSCLLCTYVESERSAGERILFENESFVVLVPYWAFWPFETMIIPRRHCGSIDVITEEEKTDLAAIMVELGICYDNLFQTSFPYSMGIHQRPTDGRDYPGVHYHFHYLPPLLRSQTIKKHMVGFELLATVQRDLTPEIAAARLRELPRTHYLEGRKDR
jgi:UDPglucose--hexose-1-phosphate uridylyltransferase